MRNFRHQATQDEINDYRDTVRAEFAGQNFEIESNGYGLRVECNDCHESQTLNPEMWLRNHGARCAAQTPMARTADYRTEATNADGTKNITLHYV